MDPASKQSGSKADYLLSQVRTLPCRRWSTARRPMVMLWSHQCRSLNLLERILPTEALKPRTKNLYDHRQAMHRTHTAALRLPDMVGEPCLIQSYFIKRLQKDTRRLCKE